MAFPAKRVMEKLDQYMAEKDFAAAERHLAYWLREAEADGDPRGRLTVLNEQIGFYRKTERETEAIAAAEAALALLESLSLDNSPTAATTLINAATAYKAFGRDEAALPLYERAKEIYEAALDADDTRLGGLYNNMALTVMSTGDYRRAEKLFRRAIAVMEKSKEGAWDMAVSYCNLADLAAAEHGLVQGEAKIAEALLRAMELLRAPELPRNAYDAFVCEKCAPTFDYYGFFILADELKERARSFYERT